MEGIFSETDVPCWKTQSTSHPSMPPICQPHLIHLHSIYFMQLSFRNIMPMPTHQPLIEKNHLLCWKPLILTFLPITRHPMLLLELPKVVNMFPEIFCFVIHVEDVTSVCRIQYEFEVWLVDTRSHFESRRFVQPVAHPVKHRATTFLPNSTK